MTSNQFRDAINQHIRDRGLTVGAASRLSGVSDQTVRDYLSGKTDATMGTVLRIATAVGLTVVLAESV